MLWWDYLRVMREVLRWLADEGGASPFVLATVVSAHGSVPLPVGTAMAVFGDGAVAGGVSGGCVDADICARAEAVMKSGVPQLVHYNPSADVESVALTCGGALAVFVERIGGTELRRFLAASRAVQEDRAVTRTVIVSPPASESLGVSTWEIGEDEQRRGGATDCASTCWLDGNEYFRIVFAPRPRMLLFGFSPFVSAMCVEGNHLGYAVTVCDSRGAFLDKRRFPAADDIVISDPAEYLLAQLKSGRVDERSVLLSMTHSERFDVSVLRVALQSIPPLAYVGALGSETTALERRRTLTNWGISARQLKALCMPAGLPVGGRSPQQVAVSIAAEIIACTNRQKKQKRPDNGPALSRDRSPGIRRHLQS